MAGTLLAVLGGLAVIFPFVTGLSLSVLLGVVLVAGAIVHVLHASSTGTLRDGLGQVTLAVVYGVAGIIFLANPLFGLLTLTLLAVGFFIADGVVEVAWGIRSRGQPGAVWLLASGSLSLLLGGFLWSGFPTDAVWAVGVLFGINLLVTGVSVVLLGQERDSSVVGNAAQRSRV
ncbi:hypothetical protein C464_09959 [Halorubrum coriense DSM 10284]|uniref:HdeD family acid-resistance protein n=1 Tax=Halorubrum coriense DSM 10284 TaxID=1227466 RepID=M0EIT8_9EURY|nr:DUF308 domain-containing protein [Halorubrum coriense]ELZ46973.1 hypothetical protein C464_09959 [Halorubrum coriense DSM 10284]